MVVSFDRSRCLPGLYVRASRVSMSAQKKYMMLVKADLISVTLAALLSIWESLSNVAAVMMLLSALATYCVWKSAWAKLWFDGRAVAEFIKSLSWRFMTGSD